MLSDEEIKKIATKNQTTEVNAAREYTQHVFLSRLYQKKDSENVMFKGGTALRIIYGSPRFSEDLDYTVAKLMGREVKRLVEGTVDDMGKEGFEIDAEYNKTSGGWIIPLETKVVSWPVHVELNLSQRKKTASGQFQLISSPYVPAYSVNVLTEEKLVSEKIEALLSRRKSRDYYDLYFLLRSNLPRKPIVGKKDALVKAVESVDNAKIKMELKAFLPASHWLTIANLKRNLSRELMRL